MNPSPRIERVLLIMPPATISKEYTKEIQPPLGLAYIAACLEPDYTVKIIDAACEGWDREVTLPPDLITYGLSFSAISDLIRDYAPDVVGVSCLFSMQHKNAHQVCALAKKINKETITLIGGSHPTVLPEETLADENIDFVVLGEGESSTKELLDALRGNKDFTSIDGIAFRAHGKMQINKKTRFIDDLDRLPFPARHLLPMEKYFKINLPHGVSTRYARNTPVITSRGCPAQCIFCSIHAIWGHTYRARSVENILQELRSLKETYKIKEIQFEDDNLTFDKQRADNLFRRMVEEDIGLSWTTPNGVALWALDESLLIKMKESGCYRLCLAIESGDQEFLAQGIRKPLNLEKIKNLIETAGACGFETDAFFVVGFPHETKKQLLNTFAFAEKLKVDNVSFYIATPYPGTELYALCEKGGYLPPDFSFSRLGVKKATCSSPYIAKEELERLVAYYTLKHKISLLWKNPKVFYRKVVRRFFKTPKHFFSLTKKLIRNLFYR
jgi:magnesium-protoporphyrin IX monomethyl ester (oxidative) cyclase